MRNVIIVGKNVVLIITFFFYFNVKNILLKI